MERLTLTNKKKNREQMDFSERCRLALEKSYGFKIPLPKSVGKHNKK
jgi:hypothetical protein